MNGTKPHRHRGWVVALTLLLSAGCAGAPPRESAAPAAPATAASPATTAPSQPAAVLFYVPKTLAETADAMKLARSDFESRAGTEQALDEADQAKGAWLRAAMALQRSGARPGAHPTKEEVEKLYKAAGEKEARYGSLVQEECGRYEKFLKKYPGDWYQRHRYAWFLADNYLPDEAAEQWRRVIEQEPAFPYAYNNLATLYNHMGRDLEAIRLYRKAIELYPEDADFFVNLAVNYSAHRAEASKEYHWDLPRVFHECILCYQRALALRPKDREIAYDLATQYVLAKFFGLPDTADEALAAWKYYLTLDLTPTQRAVAERNMASICLQQKNDPAQAQKLLEDALKLMPDDGTIKTILEQARAAQAKPAPLKDE